MRQLVGVPNASHGPIEQPRKIRAGPGRCVLGRGLTRRAGRSCVRTRGLAVGEVEGEVAQLLHLAEAFPQDRSVLQVLAGGQAEAELLAMPNKKHPYALALPPLELPFCPIQRVTSLGAAGGVEG